MPKRFIEPEHTPNPEAKVFVANFKQTLDLSDAQRFTQYPFEHLTEETANIYNTEALTSHLLDKLDDFQEIDYLLVSGAAVINMIALSILLKTFKLPGVNLLLFKGFEGVYYLRRVSAPE